MSNKKTAVEWLFNQIQKDIIGIEYDYADELKQAKEMEKQQIIDAFNNGEFFPSDYYHPNNPNVDGSETYYNETYGGKNEI
jgi:hypothetical protein